MVCLKTIAPFVVYNTAEYSAADQTIDLGKAYNKEQCLTYVQCPAKKFDYKLTKRTVTDLFFWLKYLMYSDHSTFYSNVLKFLWRLQKSFDISWMIHL